MHSLEHRGGHAILDYPSIDFPGIETRYETLRKQIEAGGDGIPAAIDRWLELRDEWTSWSAIAELRFRQNTAGDGERRAADTAAERIPVLQRLDAEIKAALLRAAPDLEAAFGAFTVARWRGDAAISSAAMQPDLVAEHRLADRYLALLAAATGDFRGAPATIADLARYAESDDAALRRQACETIWSIFAANADELDDIFGALVDARTSIAKKAGFASFAEIGCRRQGRTDYSLPEIARFREAIRTSIVPLASALAARQAEAHGTGRLMPWDEPLPDAQGSIRSASGAELVGAAAEALGAAHSELGEFAQRLAGDGLVDFEAREGKAGGAFCTYLPHLRRSYVYACETGTSHDALTLVHELGHAYQNHLCRDERLYEHVVPSNDAGEIASMALEFLVWPQFERFYGSDAGRARRQHLHARVLSIPYIAAIDHFQELVYAEPNATPAQRRGLWREMEARYLPWRQSGGIPHLERGGAWQRQRHVYIVPFYYIDYALAMYVALDLWSQSLRDPGAAMQRYLRLCSLGGRASYARTLQAAQVPAPFDPGAFEETARRIAAWAELPER